MAHIQEFSSKAVIEEWMRQYQKGDLLSALKKHWRQFVPLVYCHYDNPAKEERVARKLLFAPMEVFLCNGDPDAMFARLKELDRPSQICGHVFKMGEPTYCCRDCASDPTCVLCVDCFQKSAHRQHRYRMNTSSGGGYCDCGDPEAWKTEPFCETHKQGVNQGEQENPMEALPDDLVDRASTLFMSTMQYAVELLTWVQHDNLPDGLQPEGELPNTYITMLFNDEVHTYEQVISTLIRAVDCSQKEATDFATTVDREGRSCVRNGPFDDCEKARNIIKRSTARHGSKPLRVHVMHTTVVAHQQFALKLIPWLQSLIAKSDGLRRLFCILTMKPQQYDTGLSLMERILLADTQLWKMARIQTHQLFMAGVLLDQECKKQFAAMFTKWFPRLQRDFCEDDHEQDVSVTSLSVQIFTVPSLARMLIEEHDLMTVILRAFLDHCTEKIKDGRLVFERNERHLTFKRAWYMLYDLRYTLTCRPSPEEWTPKLRTNFLSGFSTLLELLKAMQGMDAVTRQTGQHLEFEPEWENAFNLQLKLRDNLGLILDWCSSDREVLISAFRATMKTLQSLKKPDVVKKEKCQLLGHAANCIKYDVGSQPVSIHIPVTRLLAGLFIQLEKFGLTDHSPDVYIIPNLLNAAEMVEPVLRILVLVSQTQAGMWRRNGYSLLNQIFFYTNVKCRGEMYDRDIVMLQIGAALMPSDQFMIHALHKFNLVKWAREQYETGSQDDPTRNMETLAEEFLTLLIVLLSERYVPGVGQVTADDVVEREIIHQLCITPLAHSELVKTLPEDVNHETGIETVIHNVADFWKPTEEQKGKFELKSECFSRYNPFFYHYSKSDQSKSEEAQLKRKKQAGLDQALPPPEPPPFCPQFASVVNLLQCDIMIQVMELVLSRTKRHGSRSCPEGQFERVLHLIGVALHEQRSAIKAGHTDYDFLQKATKRGKSILSHLENLVGDPNITHDAQKDLLTWVLKTFAEVRQMKNEPVAMETLESLTTVDSKQQEEKKKKAAKAAKRRAKIMAQMSAMQKNFIKDNADLFEETSAELPRSGSDMDIGESCGPHAHVALGPLQSTVQQTTPARGMCILCQEEQDISFGGRAMVLSAFVNRSTILSTSRPPIVPDGEDYDPLLTESSLPSGTHTSSCGHMMHSDCWQRLFDSILAKERRRPLRIRHHLSYDIDKLEFLCPLCECLSNTVIPIIPLLSSLTADSERRDVDLSFNDWLDGMQKTVHASIMAERDKESDEESLMFQPCPISTITKMMAESVARNFQLLWEYVYDDASGQLSEGMKDMLKKFTRDVYSVGLSVHPDDENLRVPLLTWHTCAYTLLTVEQCLRDDSKPLFSALSSRQSDCLNSLVKVAAVVSQIISPDLIRQHCVRLLNALIPDSGKKRRRGSCCILEIDMFSCLTVLAMTLPSLHSNAQLFSLNTIPRGGLNDLHALQLTLTGHLVQVILTHAHTASTDADVMETEPDPHAEAFLQVYARIRSEAGLTCPEGVSAWQLYSQVKEAVLPFLRCSALLFHFLTGVPPPPELTEPCTPSEEQVALCRYLSLPTSLVTLFTEQGEIINSLISRWCCSSVLKTFLTSESDNLVTYPLPVNRLVSLPEDYSDLINQVSTFTCPKSEGDDSRAPTMCLVCGQMLCSQSYCCQTELQGTTVGAATAHTHTCGLGTGIFLRVRECQILLLFGKTKGCFFPSPYLDDYGETDQGLRRGNPLHLSVERYRKLHKLWLSHGIPEEIGHQLESNNNLMGIEWQHL